MEDRSKTILSVTVDNETTEANTAIHGSVINLLAAYTTLSQQLMAKLEETGGVEFAKSNYALIQRLIIEGSCLKKDYDKHEKMFMRLKPLMDVMGKTFTADGKEVKEDAE